MTIAPSGRIPTDDESGVKGCERHEFHGLAFPGLPPEPWVMRLHAELMKAPASDDVKQELSQQDADILNTSLQ